MSDNESTLTADTATLTTDADFLKSAGIVATSFDESAAVTGAPQPANAPPADPMKPKLKVAWGAAQNGNAMMPEKTTEKVREAVDGGKLDPYMAAKALQNPHLLSDAPEVSQKELDKVQAIEGKSKAVVDAEDAGLLLRPVTMTKQDLNALFNIGGELGFVSNGQQTSERDGGTAQKTEGAGFTPEDKSWLQSIGVNSEKTAKPKSKDTDVNDLLPIGEREPGNNNMTFQERREVERLKGKLSADDLAFAIENDTRDLDQLATGKESMPIGETLREVAAERCEATQDRQQVAAIPASLPGFSGIIIEDVDSAGPASSTPAAAQMAAQKIKDQRNEAWAAANPDKVKKKDK